MKHGLDAYANLDSPIHHWEPRYKLVALLSLIFAFSFVQKLSLLPAMIIVTITLYKISQLPASFLLTRLRYPGFFLASIALLLPFSVGSEVIFQIGFLAVREEGVLSLVLVVTRFLCILTVSLIIFGTAPFFTHIKAMRSLGLPAILADMTLLSYRYIEQLADDLVKMKRAMQLRGFRPTNFNLRNLRILASLAGTLLVRSYEQSERVYRAMILRGYGYAPQNISGHREVLGKPSNTANWRSVIALLLSLLIAFGFVLAEILF
ncbi:MAG: cobalt ECF transporter T component CbiQ [Symploca sp. SIO3C6]|nr:cobalt ECF transporter T component CbiQ [Symploca sp. SIO3C6]NET06817.1 cobalt ECF transporter T component CbiQ [Symploca sp. SIO2B6]